MMLAKVKSYINSLNLLSPNSRLIVGLSGGADSVALLYVLHQLKYECIVAHCNFHLRGDESLRDELFAKACAESLDIPFHKIDFDTEKYASNRGISIEMAARELRYEWFEKIRAELGAEAVVVAHHQNDNVETFLLNLIRGTGIHGLTGIKPKSFHVVRPFLCLTRDEILSYIQQENLSYVTDSSNLQDDYVRNKIRLNILPEMQLINPSIDGAILRAIKNLQQVSTIYDADIKTAEKQVFDAEKKQISIPKLQSYIEPEMLLYEILKPFGFNSSVVKEIIQSLDGQPGKEFYSPEFKLIKDRNTLLITPKQELEKNDYYQIEKRVGVAPIELSFRLELNFAENTSGFEIFKDKKIAYFDARQLKFPLILRRWKCGDWFIPFGMSGSRKLSNYFSDQKFSKIDKEQIWLLCSGDDVIWIVGERADNRYRVKNRTREICTIKII